MDLWLYKQIILSDYWAQDVELLLFKAVIAVEQDIDVQNYKYKEWETEQEEFLFMEYNIKFVLLFSKDLVVLILSQHQLPSNLVIKMSVHILTVSTPAPTTSNTTPTTSLGVSSFLVSKYVNIETTVCKCERENKIHNLINVNLFQEWNAQRGVPWVYITVSIPK